MTKEEVIRKLNQLHIDYTKADHEAIDTMEGLKDIEAKLGCPIAKNLMLCNRQKTKFYLLMTVGDKKFKTKELSHQINSARLSFADAEYMEAYLGCQPGSLSVLGLFNDKENKVQLLVDDDILKEEYIGVHPCYNTATIKVQRDELIHIFLPYVKHDYIAVKLIGE